MRRVEKSENTGHRIHHRIGCKPVFLFSGFLLILLWATTAMAQYTTARLSGKVEDNTGAAVPGASVTVEQAGTGYKQEVKAGAAGEYLFPSFRGGDYQLTVSMPGFYTYVQQGM